MFNSPQFPDQSYDSSLTFSPYVGDRPHQDSEGPALESRLQPKSRCSNPFSSCGGKIKAWGEAHPRMKKALIGTGIALAIVTVLGGALLAYMHFSGLGISKAGFATLGGKISALATKAWTHFKGAMNSTHTMSTAQLIYKVGLPVVGATALLALLAVKGKAMKQKCAEKINQQRENFRDYQARRAERREVESVEGAHSNPSALASED